MELILIDNYTIDYNAYDEEYFIFSYNNINNFDNEHIEKLIMKYFYDIKNECIIHLKKVALDENTPKFIFKNKFIDSYREDYYDCFYFFHDFDEHKEMISFEHDKNQSKMILLSPG
jgi:hypothetical protein